MVKLVPVPKLDPPLETSYQFIIPAEAVALRATAPVPQLLPGVVPVIVGTGLTVTVMLVFAVTGDKQGVALEVSTTDTTFPFDNVDVVKVFVELLLPTLIPFTRHWYNGEAPPFVGVAVKVTELPAQIVLPGLALIPTEGTKTGSIVN